MPVITKMSDVPRDRAGLIIGSYFVAEYRVGPMLFRTTVSADPKGSTCPYFSVTREVGAKVAVLGGLLTFPNVDDCVALERRAR